MHLSWQGSTSVQFNGWQQQKQQTLGGSCEGFVDHRTAREVAWESGHKKCWDEQTNKRLNICSFVRHCNTFTS
jgi:hypothetical protein